MGKPFPLTELYRFPGFRPLRRISIDPIDPSAVVVTLVRRRKKRSAASAAGPHAPSATAGHAGSAISLRDRTESTFRSTGVESPASGVAA